MQARASNLGEAWQANANAPRVRSGGLAQETSTRGGTRGALPPSPGEKGNHQWERKIAAARRSRGAGQSHPPAGRPKGKRRKPGGGSSELARAHLPAGLFNSPLRR